MKQILTLDFIEQKIVLAASEILKVPVQVIQSNPASTLTEIGLTSVDVVELIVEMERFLDLEEVPDSFTEDDPSIPELSKRLLKHAERLK